MWSDTFLAIERAHLLRLLVWGASSIVAGTALWTVLAVRRARSPLLLHFGIQAVAWGAANALMAALRWRGIAERDLAGATRFERLLWFNAGLDVGLVLAGATLALTGWLLGRRLAAVGAGLGLVVQGGALLTLNLVVLALLARYV